MAAGHDKKRQLDDEMSRFEAEISGPTGPLRPPPPPPDIRPIIGSNTYNQVQQRLRTANDPPENEGPRVPPLPTPPLPPRMLANALNSAPRLAGPPIPPGPRLPPLGPAPPGYMGPPGLGRGFNPPPPPPGLIPPQVRHPINNGAIGNMPQMGPMMPGGHPGGLPPPPPEYIRPAASRFIGPNIPSNIGNNPNMPPSIISCPPVISKPPTVFSSAPKLYSESKDKTESGEVKSSSKSSEIVNGPEPIKPKAKPEVNKPTPIDNSLTHAQEMAEKVRQSQITTTMSVAVENYTPVSNVMTNINNINNSNNNPPGMMMTPPMQDKKKEKKSKKNLRYAGGQVWEDQSLGEWDQDDFRMFAGDLGNDVTDELLNRYFNQYPSFTKAKVVRDKRTNKSKGYGFVSFKDPQDYIRAMKEMNGRYVGSRPIKLRKSSWKDRNIDVVQKKQKEKQLLGLK